MNKKLFAALPLLVALGYFSVSKAAETVTSEQVVETAMRGVRGGRTKVVSGLTNFVGAIIGKHVPNMITTRAIARALRSKYQKQ